MKASCFLFEGKEGENRSAIKATVNSTKRQTGVFIPFLERSWHLHCLSYGNKYHDSFFMKYLWVNGQQKNNSKRKKVFLIKYLHPVHKQTRNQC